LVVLLINFPKAAPSDNRSVGCLWSIFFSGILYAKKMTWVNYYI
jgi:hypothetical protein